MKKAIAALAALACSGCSGISVDRFDGTPGTMNGVPYNLPMTVYALTITRTVTGCDDHHLKGDIQVSIVSKKIIDPSAMFTLHADGRFDTSDIKVSFDTDGVSSAVNTSVADQTATVVTSVISTAAAIAPLIALGGGAGRDDGACDPDVAQALQGIGHDKEEDGTPAKPGLKDKVAKESTQLTARSAQVTLLSSQIATLGKDADKTLRAALSDALKKQADEQSQLKADQDKLTELLKVITDIQTEQWPSQGTDWQLDPTKPFSVPDAVWKKWAANVSDPNNTKKTEFDVFVDITKLGRYGQVGMAGKPLADIDITKGIPVRFPLPARLRACRLAPCGQPASKEITHVDGPVLQFGLVYAMPVTGGAFHSTTFSLQLDASGNPTLVDIGQTAAGATTVTNALSTEATQVAGIPSAINTARTNAATAEANLVTAKNTLATAQANTATVNQLAPIQADVALKQAEVSQINANNSLEAAQKANGTGP